MVDKMTNKLCDVLFYKKFIYPNRFKGFFYKHIVFAIQLFVWWVQTRMNVWSMVFSKRSRLPIDELIYEFGVLLFEVHQYCNSLFDYAQVETDHGLVQMQVTSKLRNDYKRELLNLRSFNKFSDLYQLVLHIAIQVPEDIVMATMTCYEDESNIKVEFSYKDANFIYTPEPLNQRYIIIQKDIENLLRQSISDITQEIMKKYIVNL